MTDPITDMLNQIKNSQAVGKEEIFISLSKIKNEIAEILSKEGFIGEVKKIAKGRKKNIRIELKYNEKIPAMAGFKRISKPGQRIYKGFAEITRVKGGYGMSIISTSKGLMTNKLARKEKLGGEIICEIW